MLTLTVAGFVPSRVADWGEAEQVDKVGAPLQLILTLWLKPAIGVTLNE
jgi:hypothetical protein